MKTILSNRIASISETVKRTFYSFQVLIIGVAIPVLFIIGISNASQTKKSGTETEQVNHSDQLTANPAVGFHIVKI